MTPKLSGLKQQTFIIQHFLWLTDQGATSLSVLIQGLS